MKQIIIQTVQRITVIENDLPVEKRLVNAVFRFAVEDASMRVPLPTLTRSMHAQAPWSEVLVLQSGAEVERMHSIEVALNSTAAQTRAALLAAWTSANDAFQAELPGRYLGVYYDGQWRAAGS